MTSDRIVIVGAGNIGKMVYEYVTYDSQYDVVGFSVESIFLKETDFMGIPIVPFERMGEMFPPDEYKALVAVGYSSMNKDRESLFKRVKEKGYTCVSYLSSKSSVWRNASIGENCVIMEGATIQYKASIGNNVVIWPNASIGHECAVGNNCWISAGASIGGFASINDNSFIGINAAIKGKITIGNSSMIGAGVYINRDTKEYSVYGNTDYRDYLDTIENSEKRRNMQLAALNM